ncbi:aspartate/glutamate racemase family protein [Actibacterium sp. MT2.3-13A]|uniref:aspartate/glutamate racemase family protein n=1 Tax=Actibacterium sp. MT2.3-13A TaxID=2828332 RepID=UPI001BA697EE|nr:aspartate/glutamate racemase family protein [Actibacterium sp. MT2.3-13A]
MTSGKTAQQRTLGLIHTVPGLIPVLEPLLAATLREWRVFNLVDESLLKTTIATGHLTRPTMRRLLQHVWSATDAGADAIMVTCSSLGQAVEAARPFCTVPLVRIDEGMAIEAVAQGGRIGVLATLPTTLEPTTDLIRATADRMGAGDRSIVSHLCEGAFDRLVAGATEDHDRMVADGFRTLAQQVDVIVLAQASMTRALAGLQLGADAPHVLSSPEPGVRHLQTIITAP